MISTQWSSPASYPKIFSRRIIGPFTCFLLLSVAGVCLFLSTFFYFSIPASFHPDFIAPSAPSCRSLSSLALHFLPLPLSAWLRCEIILLLGGFPAICHCHLLALRLKGGSLFQKTHRTPPHHPVHNKFLGTRPGEGCTNSAVCFTGLGRVTRRPMRGEEKKGGEAAKEGWKIYN